MLQVAAVESAQVVGQAAAAAVAAVAVVVEVAPAIVVPAVRRCLPSAAAA